jgi:hypothetical protein
MRPTAPRGPSSAGRAHSSAGAGAGKSGKAGKKNGVDKSDAVGGAGDVDADAFEAAGGATDKDPDRHGDKNGDQKRSWLQRLTHPQVRTQRTGYTASTFLLGAELQVRVNYIDPLTAGGKDNVRLNWVSDGAHDMVALENTLRRIPLRDNLRLELQGPGLTARVDDEGLPLRARFGGVALATEFGAEMPHDSTPPKVEVKFEVRVTDKSIASLAALAGAAGELADVTTALAGSKAAEVIGNVLLTAIPVVSGIVAVVSARRALRTVMDKEAPKTTKLLAVARAVADAATVAFPLAGTLASMGVVAAAVGIAAFQGRRARKTATPPTGPPPAPPPAVEGQKP